VAVALGGEREVIASGVIVNVWPAEVPPPGAGLTTVIVAVPAVATRLADTVAVSRILLLYAVVNPVVAPFQFTREPLTNPVPFTVKVKLESPATAPAGDSVVTVGTALFWTGFSMAITRPPR
jgi:hypothetical protein